MLLLLAVAVPALALDRNAFSFPNYDLQVTLSTRDHALAAEGAVELRNISGQPQSEAALQISSSLQWLSVVVDGSDVEWLSQSYTSDIDHTGQLSEAIVKFPKPVPPGQSIQLTVRYSGTVARDATRLQRIGTPREIAERSDWDQIGENFTAFRGAGFVAWYPVAMNAASLSQSNEVFETLREWRERQSASRLRVRISRATSADGEDARAIFVGNGTDLGKDSDASANQTTVLHQEFDGQDPVIVMLTDAVSTSRPAVDAYYSASHTELARDSMIAVEAVTPPLQEWFGSPKRKVVVVELQDSQALPYTAGAFYFAPLRKVPPAAVEVELARPVTNAMIDSPRQWVRDGLAGFAQALVRERQAGRAAALELLAQWSPALVQSEEASHPSAAPSSSAAPDSPAPAPQPLATTTDEIFLRTKAPYVWWMLRDMVGDHALQAALAAYRPAEDRDTGYLQRLIEKQLTPFGLGDLENFFDDWVYRDRGLPQLRIVSAYSRSTLSSQTVTAVTVENLGETGCEVPVTVRAEKIEARARLVVPAKGKAIVRIPLDATPTEAEVNDGSVPEVSHEAHVIAVTSSAAVGAESK